MSSSDNSFVDSSEASTSTAHNLLTTPSGSSKAKRTRLARSEEGTPERSAIINHMNEALDTMRKIQSAPQDGWGTFALHMCETGREMEKKFPLLAKRMKMEFQATILKYETQALQQQEEEQTALTSYSFILNDSEEY